MPVALTILFRSAANEGRAFSFATARRRVNAVPLVAIPPALRVMILKADSSWHGVLNDAMQAVATADPAYLDALMRDDYLPTRGRLLAAFAQPFDAVQYVLVGEGPYPREASATGFCFMDGAVDGLWSASGLSKTVNRATSLRNFIKMLLVADGALQPDVTTGAVLGEIGSAALAAPSERTQTLPALQHAMTREGFLLLNASLVFRASVAPIKDAKAWLPFLQTVLLALAQRNAPPLLILWGKIAAQIDALPGLQALPWISAEHPYNLSFIRHCGMHALFGPMALLRQRSLSPAPLRNAESLM